MEEGDHESNGVGTSRSLLFKSQDSDVEGFEPCELKFRHLCRYVWDIPVPLKVEPREMAFFPLLQESSLPLPRAHKEGSPESDAAKVYRHFSQDLTPLPLLAFRVNNLRPDSEWCVPMTKKNWSYCSQKELQDLAEKQGPKPGKPEEVYRTHELRSGGI